MCERELADKVAIVTGGTRGIGYHVADKLLVEGARVVVIVDVHKDTAQVAEALRQTHGQDRVDYYTLDVCEPSNMQRVFREVVADRGRVDVVVNNAGKVDELAWNTCLDLNLRAVIAWSLEAHQLMRCQAARGTIINIASIFGCRTNPYCPVYQATKFGVMGFTKSLGHKKNYDQYGVRALAVCPGYTKTYLVADPKLFPDQSRLPQIKKFLDNVHHQDPAVVGSAVVDVFRTADSGTSWVIEEDKPIYEI